MAEGRMGSALADRGRSASRFLAVAAGLLWVGCAKTVKYPPGESLLRGEAVAVASGPAVDSLRAKVELTAVQPKGGKTSVSAALSVKPWKGYKLDVYGLPGMVEAGFLWEDTGWVLVIYGREGYFRGYGDTVDLPGLGIRGARVHDLFGFLWGDFFPGDAGPGVLPAEAKVEGDTVRYAGVDGAAWAAALDGKTGVVTGAARGDGALRLGYADYKAVEGRALPRKVTVWVREKAALEIAVEGMEANPAWKKSPFRIKVPKGFEELRRPPKP